MQNHTQSHRQRATGRAPRRALLMDTERSLLVLGRVRSWNNVAGLTGGRGDYQPVPHLCISGSTSLHSSPSASPSASPSLPRLHLKLDHYSGNHLAWLWAGVLTVLPPSPTCHSSKILLSYMLGSGQMLHQWRREDSQWTRNGEREAPRTNLLCDTELRTLHKLAHLEGLTFYFWTVTYPVITKRSFYL